MKHIPSGPERRRLAPSLVALFCALIVPRLGDAVPPLRVQTRSSLLIKPWLETPHWADTFDDILVFGETETTGAGGETQIFYWDSKGRIKFDRADTEPVVALAYKIVTLDTRSDNEVIGGQLNDVAIAPSVKIGEIADGWHLGAFAGAGTANDGHWSNGDSWYGVGAIDGATELSPGSWLHIGVGFDGNSSLWPDVPLPYVNWVHQVSEDLEFAVGLPQTAVRYAPFERLSLDVKYLFPVQVDAVAEYELLEGVRIGALYARTLEPFYQDELNQRRLGQGGNRRLFHEMDRVGGGLRWITKWFDATLGAGYAFNHRFMTGYDLRDLDTYRELDGDWYISLRLQGTF